MSENGEIYTACKNFTLPPAVTAGTNSTSVEHVYSYLPVLVVRQDPSTAVNLNFNLQQWNSRALAPLT